VEVDRLTEATAAIDSELWLHTGDLGTMDSRGHCRFVRPAPGQAPTEEELLACCRVHRAGYKTPRHWRFVQELSETASGKVQKSAREVTKEGP